MIKEELIHNPVQDVKQNTVVSKQEDSGIMAPDQLYKRPYIDSKPGHRTERTIPIFHLDEKNFEVLAGQVPYLVKSIPFLYNDEFRFRIILKGDEEHLFAWDSEIGMLRGIDDSSSVLPAGFEEALSDKLQSE